MADTHSALEQLADISEPVLSSGLQLAPLWWLLLAAGLICLTYVVLRLYLRWRFLKAKRQALLQVNQMAQQPDAAALNQLIKRVLKHYQPEHPALAMGSQQWQRWLSMQHSTPLPDLTRLLYQPNTPKAEADAQAFYQFTKQWLLQYDADAPADIAITGESHA